MTIEQDPVEASLRADEGYKLVASAFDVLEDQHARAIRDIALLEELKREALSRPWEYLDHLQRSRNTTETPTEPSRRSFRAAPKDRKSVV